MSAWLSVGCDDARDGEEGVGCEEVEGGGGLDHHVNETLQLADGHQVRAEFREKGHQETGGNGSFRILGFSRFICAERERRKGEGEGGRGEG